MVHFRDSIEDAFEQAIADGQIPGAVCVIGRGDETLCHVTVGDRAVEPERLPMESDTIFDLASLTKVVATTTVVMQLVERRVLSLEDTVRGWLPGFTGDGRDGATVRHLLAHSSGVPGHVNYMQRLGDGIASSQRRERVLSEICALPPAYTPGSDVIYSCLGFMLLHAIIEAASGRSLDTLAAESVFEPLQMRDTCFRPPAEMIERCAATEQLFTGTLLGVVHDENARYLGGVSGNAGLFSTAGDLSRFMRMLASRGELEGVRILKPESVEEMFAEQAVSGNIRRCLGWRLPVTDDLHIHGAPTAESVGHTGYTGTCVWLDRASGIYLILLTNRVHLGRNAEIDALRRRVGEIVAELIAEERHA